MKQKVTPEISEENWLRHFQSLHSNDFLNPDQQNVVNKAPFTRVRTNRCTDKNLHCSNLRLYGIGGTGRIFERLSVQVWDLKKAGQLFDRHVSISRTDSCKHPNCATFCSDSAVMA